MINMGIIDRDFQEEANAPKLPGSCLQFKSSWHEPKSLLPVLLTFPSLSVSLSFEIVPFVDILLMILESILEEERMNGMYTKWMEGFYL